MKICTKCHVAKTASDFYRRGDGPGFRSSCTQCCNAASERYYLKNKARLLALGAVYDKEHPEVRRKATATYYSKNKESRLAVNREYHKDRCKANRRYRRWVEKNPGRIGTYASKKRALKARAIPAWANTEAIAEIYAQAAKRKQHVDHVIPLNNALVCGLHCESNLRIIPGPENIRKGNRTWPDMP